MSAPARDPMALLGRYGRQLLVDGVDLPHQAALAGTALVPAHDGSDTGRAIAEAAARYLVGAGFGRVAGLSPEATAGLSALDSALTALPDVASAAPPVVHLYCAARDYGASVDVVATADPTGWAEGRSRNAGVCTLIVDLGDEATPADAVLIGAAAAEVVLDDLLGLAALPAVLRITWPEGAAEPQVERRMPRPAPDERPSNEALPPALFAELRAAPGVLAPIDEDCLAQYPNEACGLVVRKPDGRLETVVCRNLQDRYHALDPEMYPRTARAAFKLNERKIARLDEQGDTLVCIYHSHCDAGAYFSDEDVRSAAPEGEPLYPGVGYLVVSVMGGAVRAREMFHFDTGSGGFRPELQP